MTNPTDKTMDEVLGLKDELTQSVRQLTNYEDVLLVHTKFDLPRPAKPQLLAPDAFAFRWKFLVEELEEFGSAHHAGDIERAADGLIDLAYVVIGTAIFMGLPWQQLWAEVQRANMAKERGTNVKRGSFQADLIKPEGWRGPDLAKVLREWADYIEEETV